MPSLHNRAWLQAEGRGDRYSSRPVSISSSSSLERGGIPAGVGWSGEPEKPLERRWYLSPAPKHKEKRVFWQRD